MKTGGAYLTAVRWIAVCLALTLFSWQGVSHTWADQATLDELLIEVVQRGYVARVKTLLDKGANVNATDKNRSGLTALQLAAWGQHPAVVTLLIDKGAAVNAKGPRGTTALREAVIKASSPATVKLLLGKGAEVNAADENGETVLMEAASRSPICVVNLLIAAGADVNAVNKKGQTALMSAASNRPEVIRLLIAKGANVNARDEFGNTALRFAALGGQLGNLKLLIEKGADVDARTVDGSTALMISASHGKLDTASLLVEKGSDVNARDKVGKTPLMMAAQEGQLELVKLLTENGADLNAVSKYGRTAIGLAGAYGHTEVVGYFRAHESTQVNGSQLLEGVPNYPPTPQAVVESFVKAALDEVPISVEEMRSDSDILRIQYQYCPNDQDIEANRQTKVIDLGEPWGPHWREWHIVTGFGIKDSTQGQNTATVKVLYKRLGWFYPDSINLKITNDTREVTYHLAKPGKFWRIVDAYEPYISVSSAIKALECEMREIPGVRREHPSEEQEIRIRRYIDMLEKYLKNHAMR